jgi:hypothetical protein
LQLVLIFSNTQEMVDKVIPHPLVMIASDGIQGHPRNAGTYSRVLAQYVREKGTITLMDALRKMSLMPAEMLERSTSTARQKVDCRRALTPTLLCSMLRPSVTDPPSRSPWNRAWACAIWW